MFIYSIISSSFFESSSSLTEDFSSPSFEVSVSGSLDFSPEEFLYISCNPISYVKDVKRFIERGYKLKKIVGLDQFPRTVNLELISLLEKD